MNADQLHAQLAAAVDQAALEISTALCAQLIYPSALRVSIVADMARRHLDAGREATLEQIVAANRETLLKARPSYIKK